MSDAVRSADTEEARAAQRRLEEARALIGEPDLKGFFDALFRDALPDDILLARAERLVALVRAVHAELGRHKPGTIDVALLDDEETHETVIVGINDDRPFLFDSAVAAALAAGARLRAVFHPVITLEGQPTSVIVLICAGLTGAPRDAALENVREAFAQGQAAVRDWRAMLARLKTARDQLASQGGTGRDEDVSFLDWLADNHFTFLGARDYVLEKDGAHGRLEIVPGSGLGVLADDAARALHSGERTGMSAAVRAFMDMPEPLIVTKSVARSAAHRRAHMDYIGIKTFDAQGRFNGERRFVGLFTSSAYSAAPRAIPLLRAKIAQVMHRAGLEPASHDGKALTHILDTFPRDELFQISDDELLEIATGILRLGGLPRLKLFLRLDRFDRFVSAILLAPRDHITSAIRQQVHEELAKALNGRTTASEVVIDDSPMVRLHYIIGRNDGPLPPLDVKALEQHIAGLVETWDDALLRALCADHGPSGGATRLAARQPRFSPGYRDTFPAHEGARDLGVLEELAAGDGLKLTARVWRKAGDAASALRLKLYVLGAALPLSASLPVFENLGLTVIAEDSFPLSFTTDGGWRQDAMVLDFAMERADGLPVRLDEIRQPLQDAFHAVMRGEAENDGFNRLVMGARLEWRDVVILRAIAKFLQQAAITFSQAYMQQALTRNPDLAGLLVALFHARCGLDADDKARAANVAAIEKQIEAALADVPSLDDDRIIRRFKNVIDAVLRTNFWQDGARALAMKFDSALLDELPAPRPWREIFVYAPQVEGVHLRFGRIARGGIRWSDRREDFRTEILGLVKAQQVKNAVIVPVGAKGGFFPKSMPANPPRDVFLEVGTAAYKTFINALLDVTDNLDAQGRVVPPPQVLRHDGDDPYLVVAADKGTATFSDTANAIALERGFWLGDAFASGGSVGYDHKKMGITARGAWEAVKRHFRELGTDIQSQDFTVVGVGDMSGDVFGNGMLLSPHIRLVAAFDHRHIFLDPKADAATGLAERRRLFDLPRSSWDDYDRSKIGPGGGVFARTLKEIPLSADVKALIGTQKDKLSPAELIHALLMAEVDLLWFGGIGTYIKAATQTHLDVGDRANDTVRIDGSQVRARVVGEGANLGVTQLGRIEYARSGGRIDTDAVDNSAGVDTSDHEVNLKILLGGPVVRGVLSEDKRNALLASFTDDVGAHVLADNYNQTLALSVAESRSARDIDAHARFIRDLESRGRLDRAVEFLPSDGALNALAREGKGLTRPELCVLLAYAKLDLDAEILASDLPDDTAFAALLMGYFPPGAVKAFPGEADRHRLKREIISTVLTNAIINLAGPVFVLRAREISGLDHAQVARAWVLSDGAFGLSALKTRIDALDLKIDAGLQTELYTDIADAFLRAARWFLAHGAADGAIADTVALHRAGVEALRQSDALRQAGRERVAALVQAGVPDELAHDIALLPALMDAPDVTLLAQQAQMTPDAVAPVYFALGRQIGLERLRTLAAQFSPAEHWDRLALRRLMDDLSGTQRAITAKLLADGGDVEAWAKSQDGALARTRNFLDTLEQSGDLSVAKLMLASSQIQNLT